MTQVLVQLATILFNRNLILLIIGMFVGGVMFNNVVAFREVVVFLETTWIVVVNKVTGP